MLFGILVIYYDNFLVESLDEFKKVMNLTATTYQLIVVINNKNIAFNINSLKSENVDFISGSNECHEFSGWNEGIHFAKKKYSDSYQKAGYIFCNDTFCKHRSYTFTHRIIFSASFKVALISDKPTIAGEINATANAFELNNIKFNTWVSSYIFAINNPAIKLIEFDILPSKTVLNRYLMGGFEEKQFFSENMDLNLRKHLLSWLFHGGWYKSAALNHNNMGLFYCKARSILAELELSSKAHANKFNFIDTFFIFKTFDKLKTVFYKKSL